MAGVNRFEDLDAWQLASQLEDAVYALSENGLRSKDSELYGQIRASASSTPSLISEGWGRFNPADCANYIRMAKGSLNETKNHLLKAKRKKFITDAEFGPAMKLFFRAVGATAGLGRYLRSPQAKAFFDEMKRRAAGTPDKSSKATASDGPAQQLADPPPPEDY
jgi:four helix bundle protein